MSYQLFRDLHLSILFYLPSVSNTEIQSTGFAFLSMFLKLINCVIGVGMVSYFILYNPLFWLRVDQSKSLVLKWQENCWLVEMQWNVQEALNFLVLCHLCMSLLAIFYFLLVFPGGARSTFANHVTRLWQCSFADATWRWSLWPGGLC